MGVAEVEESSGIGDGEVDGGAFGNLVEVHVAAPVAGVAGGRGSAAGAGRSGDTAEHGTERDSVVGEVLGGVAGRGGAVGEVEAPGNGLAGVFHADGEVAVEGALDDGVVAAGGGAVEAEADDVDDEGVSGGGGLDVEGAGLGVATGNALDVMLVVAAGVDGGGVDGVTGVYCQDGFVEGRELTVEDGGGELVALGRRGGTRRNKGCGERDGEGVLLLGDVDGDDFAGESAVFEGGGEFVGVAVVVFGEGMEVVAGEGAFQGVAVEFAGEFVGLLGEVEAGVAGGAVEVGSDDPAPGERGCLCGGRYWCEGEQAECELGSGHARFLLWQWCLDRRDGLRLGCLGAVFS